MWSGRTLQTRLPIQTTNHTHGGIGSPLPALGEAKRLTDQPSDQESDLEEHMLSTQVDLGSMTPEVATQPPVFPASNDFLSAQGLITHANTDHPTIPTTGSTDQAQTLPTRGRKHRRQEATLEPTQFDLLQTKLGGFTHTSAPH